MGAYARKYRYLQQDHDNASDRLHLVERLLKQYDCTTSTELLAGVAEAEADLDRWFQLEGDFTPCNVVVIGVVNMIHYHLKIK